jgi:uncharacterized membrane protein
LHSALLVLGAFLACTVEMVEALTIVLAVGVTRGWRSALIGVACALAVLALIAVGLGPAVSAIPINALRIVIGGLLLIFGLQWLRKAILRAGGRKALHDEAAIFEREREAALAEPTTSSGGIDWYTFTVAFKGVLLEGLEVAFIIVTFGGAQHDVGLAAIGAAAAAVLVGSVGVMVREPLSRVPENTMKFAVGVLLTTFGLFWSSEGAGVQWPGNDASLLALLAYVALLSWLLVATLRRRGGRHLEAAGQVA